MTLKVVICLLLCIVAAAQVEGFIMRTGSGRSGRSGMGGMGMRLIPGLTPGVGFGPGLMPGPYFGSGLGYGGRWGRNIVLSGGDRDDDYVTIHRRRFGCC